ncbi:extracellular solute-binding protein [Paenibacillus pasadenensis]|uniref:ABC transporter substrate-binding protein n=1 Tax=Paenibacillus pasadenensis TaxID=217090 RepID=UPI002040D663|nr:extracellular solute-binding protein [Paenibacillus pasadenensis]MCM3746982.1 extracellular solute-binding protein [Paenibacillus pasadenensis]
MKGQYVMSGIIVIALLSGCSSPSGSPNTAASNETDPSAGAGNTGAQTLDLLVPNYYNDTEKKLWEKVVNKFKELHPDIKVELVAGEVKVESGKLTTMLQSGVTPPDAILINAGPGRVKTLSDVNLIKPLNELYTKNKWEEQLRPTAYELVAGEENIFELPHTLDAIMVFYNKDIFDKHGVTTPATKDEFMSMLEKLKEAGVSPITVGARNGYAIGWIFSNIMESVAGREAVENLIYGDGKWNAPEFVKAAETLEDWVKQGYIPKEAVTLTQADSKFSLLSKRAAMEIEGTYLISDIADQKLEDSMAAFTMPSFIEGKTASPTGGIGLTWVVPSKAEDEDLAETWLNFVLSKDFSEITLGDPTYNLIPASSSSASIQPAGAVLAQAIKDIENGFGYNPTVFIGPEAKEAYYQNLQGLLGGLVTPKQAMDNIEAGAVKDRAAGYQVKKK